ncbi:transposase [bacterium]|nr:MAG: transposase [bacterium]
MIERKQYMSEFKRDAVRLLESGLSLTQAGQQLGVNSGLLRKWKRQLQRENHIASTTTQDESYNAFPGQGRPHDEELARLRKENAALKMERDVLKKALLIFAEPGAK